MKDLILQGVLTVWLASVFFAIHALWLRYKGVKDFERSVRERQRLN